MDTKSLKKVFIAIAIGVATFILTMLSEMTLATDGATSILRSASMVEETPVTVIAEATVTRPDGSIATTSPGNFNIWGGTHVQVIVGGKELYCIQEGVIVWNPDRNFKYQMLKNMDLYTVLLKNHGHKHMTIVDLLKTMVELHSHIYGVQVI